MDGERVLIVEPDSRVVELAVIKLSNAGCLVAAASDCREAFEKASNNPPDILIVDSNLTELCAELKNDQRFKNIPVIFLSDRSFDEERLKALNINFCKILTKPFSPRTLLGAVNSVAIQSKIIKMMNPLTELPGEQYLAEEVNRRIQSEEQFDLIFSDLKDFKTYNKIYSFDQGNAVIQYIAQIIQEAIAGFPEAEAHLYHLGGDDFCILIKPGYAEDLSKKVIERFERGIGEFYLEGDRNRGGLVVTNRRGLVKQSPIMTLALAAVSNCKRKIESWLEAEMIANDMLKYAKSMPGSQFAKDRRSS